MGYGCVHVVKVACVYVWVMAVCCVQVGSQIKGGTKKSTGVQPTSGDSSTLADPILFAAAFKRNRFYVFTKREPDEGECSARLALHPVSLLLLGFPQSAVCAPEGTLSVGLIPQAVILVFFRARSCSGS